LHILLVGQVSTRGEVGDWRFRLENGHHAMAVHVPDATMLSSLRDGLRTTTRWSRVSGHPREACPRVPEFDAKGKRLLVLDAARLPVTEKDTADGESVATMSHP
jgi:hypothetical protein